jgi:hypothetical protein
MSPSDRRSLLANLAFIALLILGLRHEVAVLTAVVIGWVWMMLGLYLVLLAPSRTPAISPMRPAWLFNTLDVAVLAILIWYGWFATAGARIASIVGHDMAYRRRPTPGAGHGPRAK